MLHQRRELQSGQVGVIIILIMVVLLTVGLSVATRSTREVRLAQQEEESTRVFNAAEAGVEQALSTDLNFSGTTQTFTPTNTITGTSASVSVTKVSQLEMRLFEGTSAKVPLVDSTILVPTTSVVIDWSKDTDCASVTSPPASLLIAIYSVDKTVTPNVTSVRYVTAAACSRGDNIPVAASPGQNGYFKRVVVSGLGPKDAFLRIRPLYNDTTVLVASNTATPLPVQYFDVRSSANNQFGGENRIVQVRRSQPTAPSIFDFVLFSGTTLVK